MLSAAASLRAAAALPSRHNAGMGSRNTTTDQLRKLPLFATCARRELDAVVANTTELSAAAGTELTQQGSRGHQFFVLVSGSAEVYIDGERIRTLAPGDCFGELALINRQPRSATVVATTDAIMLVSHQTEFATMTALAPNFTRRMMESVEGRSDVGVS